MENSGERAASATPGHVVQSSKTCCEQLDVGSVLGIHFGGLTRFEDWQQSYRLFRACECLFHRVKPVVSCVPF